MARPAPERVAPGVYLLTLGRGVAATNVYLVRSAGGAWALLDAGRGGSAAAIDAAADLLLGAGARPAAILLTHVHPDHSGAAGALARSWDVPVHVHADEVRTGGGLTDVVRPLGPTGAVPALPDWESVPTPGHTPGHVAYLRRTDGVLVSGDAVLTVDLSSASGVLVGRQQLAGPPWLTTWDHAAARRSVEVLAGLGPRVIAPGHGRPLVTGTAEALHALARGLTERRRRPVRAPGRLAPRPGAGGVLRRPGTGGVLRRPGAGGVLREARPEA